MTFRGITILWSIVAFGAMLGAQERQSRATRPAGPSEQSAAVVETFEQRRPVTQAEAPEVHELPPSKRFHTDFLGRARHLELAGPDQQELHQKIERAEARSRASAPPSVDDRRVIVGIPREVTAAPQTDGTWTQVSVQDDARVWALSLTSKEATSIRVHFTNVSLPEGAKLYIYPPSNPEFTQVIEGKGPFGKGDFWSMLVPGETVALEMLEPQTRPTTDPPTYFQISEISHLFKDAIGPLSPAGSCNLDASCYSNWTTSGNSVGRIVGTYGDTYVCSGTLTGNQANDFSPLFLTATHCFGSDAQANSAIVFWLFKTSTCNGSAPSIFTTPQTVGASLVSLGPPDSTLLLLTGGVPGNIPFAGWTTSDLAHAEGITAIHHPRGSWRRISFGTKQNDDYDYPDHHQVLWNSGITEPGSSGSPAFNANHQIAGTLWGGTSSCTNRGGTDYFSKFSVAYAGLNRSDAVLVNGLPDTDSFGSHQTRQTAAAISLPLATTNLTAKVGSDDWFKFTLPANAKIVIHRPNNTDPNQAVEAWLYDSSINTYPLYPTYDSSTNTYSYRNGNTAADYYVRLSMQQGAYAHYTLAIDYFPAGPPTAALTQLFDLQALSVVLQGSVDTNGVTTDYWFDYGTDSGFASSQTSTPNTLYGSATTTSSVFPNLYGYIANLQPDTTYYYRIHARNSYGDGLSQIASFHTKPVIRSASFSLSLISFGNVTIGSSVQVFDILFNNGNVPVQLNSISVTGEGFSSNLGALSQCPPFVGGCGFFVTFQPTTPGPHTGTLSFSDAGTTYTVQLSGDAVLAPIVTLGTVNNPFWGQIIWVGEPVWMSIPITNSGSAALQVSRFELAGPFKDVNYLGCRNVAPKETCYLTLQFTPTTPGFWSGFFYIYGNMQNSPAGMYLSVNANDANVPLLRPSRTHRTNTGNVQTLVDESKSYASDTKSYDSHGQVRNFSGIRLPLPASWYFLTPMSELDSDKPSDAVAHDAYVGSGVQKVQSQPRVQ